MAGCERCWREWQAQAEGAYIETYAEVVARNAGVCTPEDQCGERHPIARGAESCRCGKVTRSTLTTLGATT